MPQEHQPRKPDAIRCPRDFPYARHDARRDVTRNKIFGPILGVARVNNVELIDRRGESFVRKDVNDTLLYPTGHPKEKQDRYLWLVVIQNPDGTFTPGLPETGDPAEATRVKFGYLLPDEHADDPAVADAIQKSYDERLAEAMTSQEHLDRMRALGIEPPEAQFNNLKAAPNPRKPDATPKG